MKRSKEWWSKFSPYERGFITWFERLKKHYIRFGYYGDSAMSGEGCVICLKGKERTICKSCNQKYLDILNK